MSADPDPNPEPPGAEDNALAYTAVSIRNRRHTAGPGFIERAEAKSGSGGSATGLAALDGPPIDPSSTAVTGSLNDPTDWASVTATLRGAP